MILYKYFDTYNDIILVFNPALNLFFSLNPGDTYRDLRLKYRLISRSSARMTSWETKMVR